MPWIHRAIVTSVLAVLAGWGVVALADEPGSPKPVLLGGVLYSVRPEVVREGDRTVVRTSVLAIEPGTAKPSWTANLRDVPASSDGKPPTASLRPIHKGLVVTVNQFASFIEPASRSVEPLLTTGETKQECEVHHKALIDDLVAVHYGLLGVQPWYRDAWKQFPHAATGCGGGCIVGPDSPKRGLVRYCPECREVERAVLAAHRDDPK